MQLLTREKSGPQNGSVLGSGTVTMEMWASSLLSENLSSAFPTSQGHHAGVNSTDALKSLRFQEDSDKSGV